MNGIVQFFLNNDHYIDMWWWGFILPTLLVLVLSLFSLSTFNLIILQVVLNNYLFYFFFYIEFVVLQWLTGKTKLLETWEVGQRVVKITFDCDAIFMFPSGRINKIILINLKCIVFQSCATCACLCYSALHQWSASVNHDIFSHISNLMYRYNLLALFSNIQKTGHYPSQ